MSALLLFDVSDACSFSQCPECGAVLPSSKLVLNSQKGRGYRCNKCLQARIRRWRVANPKRTTMSNLLAQAKRRAAATGREFSLTLNDLEQKFTTRCPLLQIDLDWSYGSKGKHLDNSPSIDRFDNTLGYTRDNIWIISHRANWLKNSATLFEMNTLATNWVVLRSGLVSRLGVPDAVVSPQPLPQRRPVLTQPTLF